MLGPVKYANYFIKTKMTKAEYEQVGTFFANRYPSLREGNLQKIGKSRNYVISIFEIDMLDIVVLVFSIFNFFY